MVIVRVSAFYRLFIFMLCLTIVTWQCYKCMKKFLDKPKGTRISISSSAGKIFPAITVCPNVLESVFKNCSISRRQYYLNAQWSTPEVENCSALKSLFDSQPEDLVESFEIKSTFSTILKKISSNDSLALCPVYVQQYGRCFTLKLPEIEG